MNLELSEEDAQLLLQYLGFELNHLENELLHTSKREFRHALAADVTKLRAIHARIAALVEGSQPAAGH